MRLQRRPYARRDDAYDGGLITARFDCARLVCRPRSSSRAGGMEMQQLRRLSRGCALNWLAHARVLRLFGEGERAAIEYERLILDEEGPAPPDTSGH